MAVAHVEPASRQGQADDQGRPARIAPPFALTLRRDDLETRRQPARELGPLDSLALVSACSAGIGLLSRARSGGLERRSSTTRRLPTPTAKRRPGRTTIAAKTSDPKTGRRRSARGAPARTGRSRLKVRKKSSASSDGGAAAARASGGGGTGQGSPDKGCAARAVQANVQRRHVESAATTARHRRRGGSSPLVPILIARRGPRRDLDRRR